jgi:predicted RNA binding protein YcfA (HicA-like mRNA interferase family)
MPRIDLDNRRIRRRLLAEGWFIHRQDGGHDVFRHPDRETPIILPRHRGDLFFGLARTIAKQAGWL